MGRHTRRLAVRVRLLACATLLSWACVYRWQLRPSAVAALPQPLLPPRTRAQHWQALQSRDPCVSRVCATRANHSGECIADECDNDRSIGILPGTPSSSAESAESPAPESAAHPPCPGAPVLFDLLVVGGGLTGLYAAVDGAQRGLRVALVERADIASGGSASAPLVVPGALAYVQRAMRQRDVSWLGSAAAVLRCAAVWHNVAPWCVHRETDCTPHANDTNEMDLHGDKHSATQTNSTRSSYDDGYRRRSSSSGTSSRTRKAGDVVGGRDDAGLDKSNPNCYRDRCDGVCNRTSRDGPTSTLGYDDHTNAWPYRATNTRGTIWTCIPVQNRIEWLELSIAARLSALLSVLSGPTRWCVRLSPADVSAALPGLPERACGAVLSHDSPLDGCAAAVSLARTAEALGVTLLTYAPVTRLEHVAHDSPHAPSATCAACRHALDSEHGVMVATIADALDRSEACPCDASSLAHDRGTTSVRPGRNARVYSRAVLNCTGRWVDAVRALVMFGNPLAPEGGTALGHFVDHSYLVVPRHSLHTQTRKTDGHGCTTACVDRVKDDHTNKTVSDSVVGKRFVGGATRTHSTSGSSSSSSSISSSSRVSDTLRNMDGSDDTAPRSPASSLFHTLRQPMRAATGLHVSTLRYNFASLSVLPWYDDCVLIGPHRSPAYTSLSATQPVRTRSEERDMAQYITDALAECGLSVTAQAMLSFVTHTVPILDMASVQPWANDMLYDGFHIALSKGRDGRDDSWSTNTANDAVPRRTLVSTRSHAWQAAPDAASAVREACPVGVPDGASSSSTENVLPVVHVYGGTAVRARDTAEAAIDAVLHQTRSIPTCRQQKLQRCATRTLALEQPAYLMCDSQGDRVVDEKGMLASAAERWVEVAATEGFAMRLVDLVFRRIHAGYTSPGETYAALPALAQVMARVHHWSRARTAAEIDLARRSIEQVCVSEEVQAMHTA